MSLSQYPSRKSSSKKESPRGLLSNLKDNFRRVRLKLLVLKLSVSTFNLESHDHSVHFPSGAPASYGMHEDTVFMCNNDDGIPHA